MSALLLFFSTLLLVFALGLQSQFVNNGHYAGAFCNSLMISLANIGALQVIHANTQLEYAAYIFGGPIGIVCSMVLFRRYFKKRSSDAKL